ncbi:MAG: hypothetical protein J0L53_14425 [Spirochaetes bacterium]|nr:hypothetical protein [Spirochaetota bacterium]MBX3721809.1 hypothetical protein [Turneriella sp.]
MPTDLPVSPRSGIPKSMGILLIVFASIYLLGSLISAGAAFIGNSFVDSLPALKGMIPKLEESGIKLEKLVAQLKPMYMIQAGQKLATAAISGFGLMAGIKLVQYTAQGLKLSVWWAISALAYLVVEIIVFFLFIQPTITKFFKTVADQVAPLLGDEKAGLELMTGLAGSAGAGGVIAGAIFMAIFPVLMLTLLNTNAAKKACGVDNVFGA